MYFNSIEFICLFLPLVLAGYFFFLKLGRVAIARSFLVLCSLIYYSWWNIDHLPVLLLSILVNFGAGSYLLKEENVAWRKIALFSSVSFNLIVLGVFKYSTNLVEYFSLDSLTAFYPNILILPLAISYFTLQQISFLVDSYYRKINKNEFVGYALFVSFFPQLLSGPIVRHEVLQQFHSKWKFVLKRKNLLFGVIIFSIGLFKKVVIADHLGEDVHKGFDLESSYGFLSAWVASLSFLFQVYFDFSAYGDMAIAVGLMFNIRLPINFYSPYRACSIIDYWRRWHITLTLFLRDYVYIPLGGNRKGIFVQLVNIIFIFTLSGIWHGASFKFVVWGVFNGIGVGLNVLWRKYGFTLPRIVSWCCTFLFVCFHLALFRSPDLGSAKAIWMSMIDVSSIANRLSEHSDILTTDFFQKKLFVFSLLMGVVLLLPNVYEWTGYPALQSSRRKIVFLSVVSVFCMIISLYKLISLPYVRFYYFQF
ncbi:MAG: MBOAT family protein [Bdellovibrionales bacterium]|nr:MBOAT family protein [Bdellovibrionales bacterium]